ncbi:hypothetical protein DASC09_061140 [Saccharomycopsis crataegensis]|uniref:DnaJ homologue subfamily C member 28 conserved domain-containing protein n=1 Tax=Saccharomycopsis crataegensis TaxID=43959 RepID=A0AAV5QVZ1_9ASCO|nr:hypothetical protein DASC09_061140 [Saccharomycopsis crataegensis]
MLGKASPINYRRPLQVVNSIRCNSSARKKASVNLSVDEDASAKKISDGSMVDSNIKLSKIYDEIAQKEYDENFFKEISYSKIPPYADKLTKDIAISKPWRGEQGASEISARITNDSNKYIKKRVSTAPTGFELKKKLTVPERMIRAKENSLDYTLLKHTSEEDSKFREMMREKLLGPEQVTRVSFSDAFFLADAKIADAKAKGQFNNLPKGKPLDHTYQQNPYLDTTDYHLNNILKRQEVKIPWIEKQGSVAIEVKKFRENLKKEWVTRAVHKIDNMKKNDTGDDKLKCAEYYSVNYAKLIDRSWEDQKKKFLNLSIRHLNDSIRGYNLQAPMASHIFYLVEEKELARCYKDGSKEIVSAMKNYIFGDTKSHMTSHEATKQHIKSGPQQSISGTLWKIFSKK